MTLDRQAARERGEAATPGPWWSDGGSRVSEVFLGNGADTVGVGHPGFTAHWYADEKSYRNSSSDAAFIAHARTDFPAALDMLDEKDAEIARLKALLAERGATP